MTSLLYNNTGLALKLNVFTSCANYVVLKITASKLRWWANFRHQNTQLQQAEWEMFSMLSFSIVNVKKWETTDLHCPLREHSHSYSRPLSINRLSMCLYRENYLRSCSLLASGQVKTSLTHHCKSSWFHIGERWWLLCVLCTSHAWI